MNLMDALGTKGFQIFNGVFFMINLGLMAFELWTLSECTNFKNETIRRCKRELDDRDNYLELKKLEIEQLKNQVEELQKTNSVGV